MSWAGRMMEAASKNVETACKRDDKSHGQNEGKALFLVLMVQRAAQADIHSNKSWLNQAEKQEGARCHHGK